MKQKPWLTEGVYTIFEVKLNFNYNSLFLCIPALLKKISLQNLFGKSVFCVVIDTLFSLSGVILQQWLINTAFARLAQGSRALSRCCPSSAAAQPPASSANRRAMAGALRVAVHCWGVLHFLMIHQHSVRCFIKTDLSQV